MTLSFSEKWTERMGELAGQPKGLITEWQDYTINNGFINYKSYCMVRDKNNQNETRQRVQSYNAQIYWLQRNRFGNL